MRQANGRWIHARCARRAGYAKDLEDGSCMTDIFLSGPEERLAEEKYAGRSEHEVVGIVEKIGCAHYEH